MKWLGIAFATCIALVALMLEEVIPLAPVAIGLIFALAIANLPGTPKAMAHGTQFTAKWGLFAAIVLLGFRIRWADLVGLGSNWWFLLPALGVPLLLAWIFSKRHGKTAALIGVGTAICGVSAMAAARPVLGAKDDEFAAAVGAVTVLGTIGLLLYPLVGFALGLSDETYGTWAGLTLHAVPQAVGAGFAVSQAAGGLATTFKLARVAALPVVLFAARPQKQKIPLEVIGFLAAVLIGNLGILSNGLVFTLAAAAKPLLVLAMVAIGLQTRFASMRMGHAIGIGAIIWIGTSLTVLWMLS